MNQANTLSSILMQSSNCYYLSLDEKENISGFNKAFQTLFPANSLYQINFSNLLPKSIQKHWRNAIDQLNIENQPTSFIAEMGDQTIVHWEILPNKNAVGNIEGYEMVGTPVTGNKPLSVHEGKLQSVVNDLEKIMAASLDIICTIDEEGKFTTVSEASKYILGYTPREMVDKYYFDFLYPADVYRSIRAANRIQNGFEYKDFENRYIKKDQSIVHLMWSIKWDEKDRKYYGIGRDVTDKKRSELELKDSEEKYKLFFLQNPVPMWIFDIETLHFLEVNDAAIENYGFSREEFCTLTIKEIRPTEEILRLNQLHDISGMLTRVHQGYWKHRCKDGSILQVEIIAHLIDYEGRKAKLVLAADRTQQVQAEEEIIRTNERYAFVTKATNNVIWDWDLITNKIEWNSLVTSMFGYEETAQQNIDWWQNNLHPDDKDRVVEKLQEHVNMHNLHWEDEYRFRCADGGYKYIFDRGFTIYDEFQQPMRMIGSMQDLSDLKANELKLKELNTSLEKRAKELAESNSELERFAYVASHDLQEPLRMVSSFLQLIEKKYKERLDQKGHEYIAFAVDGAERMKGLILDLLEYSRVNTSKEERDEVNVNAIVTDLATLYKNALSETKGSLAFEALPIVHGSKTQIMQLFQNLVGNAIKYKSDHPPVIKISCKELDEYIEFSVADNGIGIDERFFNKIFIIFQRLHNREQYSGTGIGLAICKKIVDRHGGRIWLTSSPGKGSTFYFTLPK